ncbi:hypothetical protein K0M31_001280 [Melipona bicolor]|uniref:Uncharacterized protein n=1 Tax=Melipona bicolor TaxID=60889 RepID=A0AA40GF69_9HYME|nr:hypothetical protein K0M31_001280 [Melipona bicolor]
MSIQGCSCTIVGHETEFSMLEKRCQLELRKIQIYYGSRSFVQIMNDGGKNRLEDRSLKLGYEESIVRFVDIDRWILETNGIKEAENGYKRRVLHTDSKRE